MHDSLTVEVALRRFTAWRAAVCLLAMLAAASLLAWVSSRTAWAFGAQLAAGGGGAVVLALVARSLLAMPSGVLACRGGRWTFAPDAAARGATVAEASPASMPPTEVNVEVALDFGGFLLLRLVAIQPAARPRLRWLAAERAGVADRWQALRCALYAPRPAAAALGAPPAPRPE